MSYYAIQKEEHYSKFRVGDLAGLNPTERLRQQREHNRHSRDGHGRLLQRPPIAQDKISDGYSSYRYADVCKAHTNDSLADCLAGLTVEKIKCVARNARIQLPAGARKAQLVAYMTEELPKQADAYRDLLVSAGAEVGHVVDCVTQGNTVPEDSVYEHRRKLGAFPFIFLCMSDGRKRSWYMPPELRSAFAEVDFSSCAKQFFLQNEIARLVYNFVTLCGIASMSSIYEAFSLLYPGEFESEESLKNEVMQIIDSSDWQMSLWMNHGAVHVAHLNAEDDPLYGDAAGQGASYDEFDFYDPFTPTRPRPTTKSIWDVGQHEEWAELLAQHRQVMSKASTDQVLQGELDNVIYNLPCIRALTSFFDAHIPAGKDAYTFADTMVDHIIWDIMFQRKALIQEIKQLTEQGWYLSEHGRSAPQLTLLVMRAYRELPRWELNGWSEVEFEDMQMAPHLISDSELVNIEDCTEAA